jgi:nicotinate dehydrogenase subunit B
MKRRAFLQSSAGLVVGFSLNLSPAQAQPAPDPRFAQVDAWLKIAPNGKVTFHTGKVELGTGIRTALAQMIAEELDVAVPSIELVMGDTDLCPDQIGTFGSLTIMLAGPQVRQAAAEARLALIERAAQRLGVPADQIQTAQGVARAPNGASLSYGELAQGPGLNRAVSGKATLKTPAQFKQIGQSVPRVEIPAKVCGTHEYIQHVRVPGMLHGRIIRPDMPGAAALTVDDSALKSLAGAPRLVRKGEFLAVVAETEDMAVKAAQAVKVVWGAAEPLPTPQEVPERLRSTRSTLRELQRTGRGADGLAQAAKTHQADYYVPFQLHASIGPSCAVADVRADRATVWSATQTSFLTRGSLATMLGMKPGQVRLIWIEGSGCYGQNGSDDVSGDAALLSQLVGKPVRVQWTRRQEHQWEPKGAAMAMTVKGGLDASGQIVGWDYGVWSPNHALRPFYDMAGNVLAGEALGMPARFLQAGADRNAKPTYDFANSRVVLHLLERSPLRSSSLRGLGSPQNTFANESFIDELAVLAGADAIDFRVRHLKDERAIAVLRAVEKLAAWDKRPSGKGSKGTGRGVAFVQYDNNAAYVAIAMQVQVDEKTGKVKVENVYVAHDCGMVVNPDGVRSQIEGNVIQTLSRALLEEVQTTRREITSVDWVSYPIMRFSELPGAIHMELIDRPTVRAVGAGEGAASPIFPALANAIYDATGVRLRSVPFTPERLLAARQKQLA